MQTNALLDGGDGCRRIAGRGWVCDVCFIGISTTRISSLVTVPLPSAEGEVSSGSGFLDLSSAITSVCDSLTELVGASEADGACSFTISEEDVIFASITRSRSNAQP